MKFFITVLGLFIFIIEGVFGQCWERVLIPGYEDYIYHEVMFTDSLTGWLELEGNGIFDLPNEILRTKDGGETWQPIENLLGDHTLNVHPYNKDTIYISAFGERFYYSYDGGNSFEYYDLEIGIAFRDLEFVSSMEFFGTWHGRLCHSINGGKDWEVHRNNSADNISFIHFFNKIKFGYMVLIIEYFL